MLAKWGQQTSFCAVKEEKKLRLPKQRTDKKCLAGRCIPTRNWKFFVQAEKSEHQAKKQTRLLFTTEFCWVSQRLFLARKQLPFKWRRWPEIGADYFTRDCSGPTVQDETPAGDTHAHNKSSGPSRFIGARGTKSNFFSSISIKDNIRVCANGMLKSAPGTKIIGAE